MRIRGNVHPAALKAAGLLLFGILSFLAVIILMKMARNLPLFTVDPSRIHCSARPEWLDMSSDPAAEVMGEIRTVLSRFKPQTIFDDTFIRLLQRDIRLKCPWVEKVSGVERVFPSQVKIKLSMRRPAAVFYRRSRGYYIDSRGVIIDSFPADERDRIADKGLPEIRGAALTAPLRGGKVVDEPALKEAAAAASDAQVLARILGERMVRIKTIDVSAYGRGRPEDTVFVTESGARLNWGRSSRHAGFKGIDPTVEQKAENLERVLDKRPGLAGVAEVTLAFSKPTFRDSAEALTEDIR